MEAVCLPDYEFYLVVGCLNSSVAHPEADRVKNMLLVTANLTSKITDCWDAAVACPPEPGLQLFGSLIYIIQFQKQSKLFLDQIGTIESRILLSNHLQTYFLVVREILRCFAKSIVARLISEAFCLAAERIAEDSSSNLGLPWLRGESASNCLYSL